MKLILKGAKWLRKDHHMQSLNQHELNLSLKVLNHNLKITILTVKIPIPNNLHHQVLISEFPH